MREIDSTILMIKDRIAEILESGDMKMICDKEGLPTERTMRARRRHRFLVDISTKLQQFQTGEY